MSERKHLNPSVDSDPSVHPTRRQGGARRELSDRVTFRDGKREVDGWALNASRSGLRAIVEEAIPLGAEFEVSVGDAPPRPGRVVWLQEEKDGAIVGVNFLDEAGRSGSIPDIQALPGRPLTPLPGAVRLAAASVHPVSVAEANPPAQPTAPDPAASAEPASDPSAPARKA